jgi:hypothetical protein
LRRMLGLAVLGQAECFTANQGAKACMAQSSMAKTPKVRGTGWVEPRKLESPGGQGTQDLIENLVNVFQPHSASQST